MKRALVIGVLLLLLASVGAGLYAWRRVRQPYQGYADAAVIEIPSGFGSREIVDRLHAEGAIRDRSLALAYLYVSPYRGRLQAGEYLFDRPLSMEEVFRKLAAGQVRLYTLTLPEGLRLDQIAERWEAAGFGPREDFLQAAAAALPLVHAINPAAPSAEGYLFPETYSFPKGVTPEEAVAAMVREFQGALARLEALAPREQWPLDLNDTLVLASLVESEASAEDERVLVSSVFHNRLARGMLLQCDPTVIYALIQAGAYRGRLLLADLQFDSPYNTYRYPELPPGPISNPGFRSLLAAIRPAETDYLFFVRTDGGRHTFSATLAEHNRAVAAYRRGVTN